ncbi:ABC transporter substrate-binding protein [Kineosporia babensis]|uniref:ABC transporter substrate-binding protein n=1 Tax=Kineosporia babensis TaxID=499548 RepID=A0A9X1NEU8_9ACTN|nr:ABC transporter substrate-binding protein [Kineosporia babensis]MCD5312525.1 ABC transporter substrate-binding protein [Kineosporia babensis]
MRGIGATVAVGAIVALAACAPPSDDDSSANGEGGVSAASATSAEEFGGMDALIAAAKEEGKLNTIALPDDWANYGELKAKFTEKYGIEVVSDKPDAASQEEINAVKTEKGRSSAPDVLDMGGAVTLANTALYAPYKVATFDDIPAAQKDPNGLWVNDYGGFMSIGYDSSKFPEVTSLKDLLDPKFKNSVALNGDPTQAGAAFAGVAMASLGNGGSADDISKGVDFFADLKKAGNFVPVQASPATIKSGETPVVFDWDYLNAAQVSENPNWKVVVPEGVVLGSYYNQAINKEAPHPAAARLWQEFLFSDEGQNLWLKGGARPVRMDAMTEAGTIDAALAEALPAVEGEPVFLTTEQTEAATKTLTESWAKAIG